MSANGDRLLLDKGLPANIDAERFVLGSVLLDGERYAELATALELEDFALEKHRRIWSAMMNMATRGVGVDRVTVAEELQRTGELEAIGGLSYLVSLDEGLPTLPNLQGYFDIIRGKRVLRDVIQMARQVEGYALLEAETGVDLIARAEAMVRGLGLAANRSSEFRTPMEILTESGGINHYLTRAKERAIPSGFQRLDDITGGLKAGALWIIGGSTGQGKTTLARNIAQLCAGAGHAGAFVSLEMTRREILDGMICSAGQFNTHAIARQAPIPTHVMRAAIRQVENLPIHIWDRSGVSIPKLQAVLRRLKSDHNIRFAVVDYLQLMETIGRFGSRAEAVSTLSRGLKLLAMELEICILGLAQLNREQQKLKRRPELYDLRESGSIEQDADVVAFVWSEFQPMQMEEYPTELIIAKQRGGSVGTVHLGFVKRTGTFVERGE